MNRRDTEPYVRWCGRTAGVIPRLLPDAWTVFGYDALAFLARGAMLELSKNRKLNINNTLLTWNH